MDRIINYLTSVVLVVAVIAFVYQIYEARQLRNSLDDTREILKSQRK